MLCRDPISILHHFVTSHQQHCRENGHIDHSVADESLNVSRPIGQSHTRTCALTARLQCNEATSAVRPLWILHHDSIAEHTQTSVSSECIRCLGARMPPRLSSAGGSARATLRQLTSRDGNLTEEAIRMATQRFDVEIAFKVVLCNSGIAKLGGLENCINLVELNLTGNSLTKIQGLEGAIQLRKLVLASNKLALVEGIWHLSKLEVLHLQDNKISGVESLFLKDLEALPSLRGLYLQNLDRSCPNPVCKVPSYKATLLNALPNLWNLDGERSPLTVSYASLSEEAAHIRMQPLTNQPIVLPELKPWLKGLPTDLTAGAEGDAASSAFMSRQALVTAQLDECEVLHRLLRDDALPRARAAAKDRESGS